MLKNKFAWATAKSFKEADYILFGVPDESGNRAPRKGASKGPNALRKVSRERGIVNRKGKISLVQPTHGKLTKTIFDAGNIKKTRVKNFVKKIVKAGKKPITVGGDHSITFQILKGLNESSKKFSLIYMDAHPDIICSEHYYYGSVVCDAMSFKKLDLKKSVEVGIRDPEAEELKTLARKKILTIHAIDFVELGVKKVFKKIKRRVGKNVYLSIDLDVIDPAFAPGVDTPVPGGLKSNEFIYLVKEISSLGLIGFDIMELSPKHDVNEMTSHLAAKTIMEIVAGKGKKHK